MYFLRLLLYITRKCCVHVSIAFNDVVIIVLYQSRYCYKNKSLILCVRKHKNVLYMAMPLSQKQEIHTYASLGYGGQNLSLTDV